MESFSYRWEAQPWYVPLAEFGGGMVGGVIFLIGTSTGITITGYILGHRGNFFFSLLGSFFNFS